MSTKLNEHEIDALTVGLDQVFRTTPELQSVRVVSVKQWDDALTMRVRGDGALWPKLNSHPEIMDFFDLAGTEMNLPRVIVVML